MTYPIRTFEHATIAYVVDGDTLDLVLDLGFSITLKQRFRMLRIDTPERGQPGWAEARDHLANYVGMRVVIQSRKIDKYGRYLCELFVADININGEMLALGLAAPYGEKAQ